MKTRALWFIVGLLGTVAFAGIARAAGDEDGWGEEGGEGDSSGGDEDQQYLDGKEKKEIPDPVKDPSKGGLHEDDDTKYYALGFRLRWIMIPEWMIFGVDTMQSAANERGTPLISNVGVGPEFIYRRGGFDITAAIWYTGLGWHDISMKGEGESVESWEVIENNWHAIMLTADFIWSTSIRDWVAITYGVGLGFGFKWGEIIETEASEASGYLGKCSGPGATLPNTNIPDQGCTETVSEGEYGKEIWPAPIVPWAEFLLGARFKPHRNVSIYIDGGFSLGFQVGARVHYIF